MTTFFDIYKQLGRVSDISAMQKMRFTMRIAFSDKKTRDGIMQYLENGIENDNEAVSLAFVPEGKTEETNVTVTVADIKKTLGLSYIPAMLYLSWLKRSPRQAALFVRKFDTIEFEPGKDIRSMINPELLRKADAVARKKDKELEDVATSNDEVPDL